MWQKRFIFFILVVVSILGGSRMVIGDTGAYHASHRSMMDEDMKEEMGEGSCMKGPVSPITIRLPPKTDTTTKIKNINLIRHMGYLLCKGFINASVTATERPFERWMKYTEWPLLHSSP